MSSLCLQANVVKLHFNPALDYFHMQSEDWGFDDHPLDGGEQY